MGGTPTAPGKGAPPLGTLRTGMNAGESFSSHPPYFSGDSAEICCRGGTPMAPGKGAPPLGTPLAQSLAGGTLVSPTSGASPPSSSRIQNRAGDTSSFSSRQAPTSRSGGHAHGRAHSARISARSAPSPLVPCGPGGASGPFPTGAGRCPWRTESKFPPGSGRSYRM